MVVWWFYQRFLNDTACAVRLLGHIRKKPADWRGVFGVAAEEGGVGL
jgi:hypothetical protein